MVHDDGDTPDATVIVPQHDLADLTIAAIRGLRRWERTLWPVVVVDDGSGPDAAAAVERLCGDVCVIRQAHRGVTAAWNRGLQAASTPFAILLNNDVTIDGAWVDALLAPLRDGSAVISGVERRREGAVPARVLDLLGISEFLAGWCWAFRRDAVGAIGGFDESLRLYFSDTDLQARLLRENPGAANPAVVPGLPLKHSGHSSTRLLATRRAIWREDRRRFIRKWTNDVR